MVLRERKTLNLSGGLEVGEVFSLHRCITCPVCFFQRPLQENLCKESEMSTYN